MNITGGGVSTFGDDVAVWSFDGAGALTETGVTTYTMTPSGAAIITGGTTLALASTSGSLLSLSDGVFTLSATSGAVSEAGLTTLDLSGSGTMVLSGEGANTIGSATCASMTVEAGVGALVMNADTTAALNAGTTITLDAGTNTTITATTGVIVGDAGNPTFDLAGSGAVTASGNPTWNTGTAQVTIPGPLVSTSLITTDQDVASGTPLVVGGRALAAETGTAVTNTTTETASASHTIPASTMTEGKAIRVTWGARATATNATDTLVARLRLGGVAGDILQATTAVDVADNNVAMGVCTFSATAAPGAAVQTNVVGMHSTWAAAGGALVVDYPLALTPATNGALDLVLTLEWSVASTANSAIVEIFDVVFE